MTSEDIKALKPGVKVTLWDYDRCSKPRQRSGTIMRIIERKRPSGEWCTAQVKIGTGSMVFVIETDDYIIGMGYETHEEVPVSLYAPKGRKRIRGAKLSRF